MKVWAVWEGEYSDSRVLAVFATEELAREFETAYHGPPEDRRYYDWVSEWEVREDVPPVVEWWYGCTNLRNAVTAAAGPTIERRTSAPSLFGPTELDRQPPTKLEKWTSGGDYISAKGPDREKVLKALTDWEKRNKNRPYEPYVPERGSSTGDFHISEQS